MKIIRLFLIGIFLYTQVGHTDDAVMPSFSKLPIHYENQHQVGWSYKEPTYEADKLIIGDITEEALKFWFWIIGTNGHQCSASGVASKGNGAYIYTEETTQLKYVNKKLIPSPVTCTLRIELRLQEATLTDVGGFCYETHCGARANIGEVTFKKTKQTQHNPS